MTIWELASWIANCQLFVNDANILGVTWAILLTVIGYYKLKRVNHPILHQHWVFAFLFSITLVVWVNNIVDVGIITPVAIGFGRWSEMPSISQPLSPYTFLMVYPHVLGIIGMFAYFYYRTEFLHVLQFTKWSLVLTVAIAVYFVGVMLVFGRWNYNLLVDPMRTIYFWAVYPELRVLWGLLFVSIIKYPKGWREYE